MGVATQAGQAVDKLLIVGSYGQGLGYAKLAVSKFRAALTDAVTACRGEVRLIDAAEIHAAVRFELLALWAQRQLRLHGADWNPETRLSYARCIADATDKRNRCLARLKIDEVDPWLQIPQFDAPPEQAAEPAADAGDAAVAQDAAGGAQSDGDGSEHHDGQDAAGDAVDDPGACGPAEGSEP
jgi:hypothetical protein